MNNNFKTKFTQEKFQEVIRLRNLGKTFSEISQAVGIHRTTIPTWFATHGFKDPLARKPPSIKQSVSAEWKRPGGKYFTPEQRHKIWKMVTQDKMSITEVSKRVGCSTSGIYLIVLRETKGANGKGRVTSTTDKGVVISAGTKVAAPATITPNPKLKISREVTKLTDENEFLKWWNIGERKKWVDRLLDEIQK